MALPKDPASLEPHNQIVLCHIQDTRWAGSYISAEVQSVYYAIPADRAIHRVKCKNSFISGNSV